MRKVLSTSPQLTILQRYVKVKSAVQERKLLNSSKPVKNSLIIWILIFAYVPWPYRGSQLTFQAYTVNATNEFL
jgi:hypothetical protein